MFKQTTVTYVPEHLLPISPVCTRGEGQGEVVRPKPMNIIFNQNAQKEKRRSLRRRSTKAERTLWQNLRNRGIEGFKFRRQFSVGPFVLDFYCPELKLAIEVDGYSHDSEKAKKYDVERQKIIEIYGVRFLRIRDEEVHEDIENTLKKIKTEILKRIDNDKKL